MPGENKQRPSGPPALSPIDLVIQQHHGSSVAIETTREMLQASKHTQLPSLSEKIVQLQRENSRLKHEVAYYREMEASRRVFHNEIRRISTRLQKALFTLGDVQRQVESDWREDQESKDDIRQ